MLTEESEPRSAKASRHTPAGIEFVILSLSAFVGLGLCAVTFHQQIYKLCPFQRKTFNTWCYIRFLEVLFGQQSICVKSNFLGLQSTVALLLHRVVWRATCCPWVYPSFVLCCLCRLHAASCMHRSSFLWILGWLQTERRANDFLILNHRMAVFHFLYTASASCCTLRLALKCHKLYDCLFIFTFLSSMKLRCCINPTFTAHNRS